MNVSTYWTLPPSRQGKVRQRVAKEEQELQRITGYYTIYGEVWSDEFEESIEFMLFCSKCYKIRKRELFDEYSPITKEQYLDKNHDMHGEVCDQCKKPLA